MYGQKDYYCLCGALDCPRCRPDMCRPCECEGCHEIFGLWALDNDGYCDDCQSKESCSECGDRFAEDELIDGICKECSEGAQ